MWLFYTPDIQDEISERLSLEAAIDALPQSDREIIRLRYYGLVFFLIF